MWVFSKEVQGLNDEVREKDKTRFPPAPVIKAIMCTICQSVHQDFSITHTRAYTGRNINMHENFFFLISSFFYSLEESFRSIVANVLDCNIVVSEFEL